MHMNKDEFPIDVDNQSIEIPGSGGARQSTLNPIGVLGDYLDSETKTFVEAIQRGCRVSNNGPCLGWLESGDYKWMSYEEVIQRSKTISSGLVLAGLKQGQETFIGIFAQNSVEWVLVEFACYYQSWVNVPLYETLGPNAVKYILNHVEAETVICGTVKKVNHILDIRDEVPCLKMIVSIEKVTEEVRRRALERGVTLHQLQDIEDLGKRNPECLKLPIPSDLATLSYTSGTTGNPKGVMLTHENFLINAGCFLKHWGTNFMGPEDRYLSHLPLAHAFGRCSHLMYLMSGVAIGFYRGDTNYLLEDMSILKPTLLNFVPRLMNKLYHKLQNEFCSSKVKSFLLNAALRAKEAELKNGYISNDSVWDNLILRDIRNALGGNVRMLIIGGAPSKSEILSFFRYSLGCAVLHGYGQTESTGAISCSVIGDWDSDTVGPPVPSCFIKLIDVPEMNYYAKNGEGEILIKGPTVTKGYFKDPEKTAEVLDSEGWLYTGDIGRWTERGSLVIVDRKKHLLKLSQAEYISPERIEIIYLASPYVEQIFVHGDSLEDCLVAVVVPNKEALLSWCSQSGIKGSFEEICQNEVVKKHILKNLYEMGKEAGLNGFEQVKALHLHPDNFTESNGLLTALLKMKRRECHEMFKDIIKSMYKSLSEGR